MIKIYNYLISNILVFKYLFQNKFKYEVFESIEVIVFSYNRPLQLKTLIESFDNYLDKNIRINILYKFDLKNKKLYEILIKNSKQKKQFRFIFQKYNFKKSLNNLLKNISQENNNNKQILFFVDDQILYRKINLTKLKKITNLTPISTLRIGLNTKWSFNLNKKQSLDDYQYSINKDTIIWKPEFRNDELSYIFSFDGSTIPFLLFNSFCQRLIFKGPNSLESSMNYGSLVYKIFGEKISCFKNQSVINIVITKVQNETNNRGSFLNLEKVNNLFLENWSLKLDKKYIKKINSPHTANGIFLVKDKIKKFIY